jgi:hypothetical protein
MLILAFPLVTNLRNSTRLSWTCRILLTQNPTCLFSKSCSNSILAKFLKCKLWWPTTHATWPKLLLSIFFFLSLNHTNTIYTSPTIPNFHLNFHSNQSLATSLFFLSLNPKMIQEKDYPEYQLTSLTPQTR